jgi:hypothetical protein
MRLPHDWGIGSKPKRSRERFTHTGDTTMATTVSGIQAGIAYHETMHAIRAELDILKAQLVTHQMAAQAAGTHWGHVGDLTDLLMILQRITQPAA